MKGQFYKGIIESYTSEIYFIASSPFKLCHLHMNIMYIVLYVRLFCVFICFIEGHLIDWLY